MMLRTIRIASLIVGLCALGPVPAAAAGELASPAPVYLPFDAKIKTEVNISNNDVLGLVRELLPSVGELVKIGAAAGSPMPIPGGKPPVSPETLAKLDLKPLGDVLEGVTNVRFIVAGYRSGVPSGKIMPLFDSSASKAGGFTKIVTNFSLGQGVLAVYAQPGGMGYLAYSYDAKEGTLYAARISGRLDAVKLMGWIGDTIKVFTTPPASPESKTEPAPEPAPGN
jgi:hypothetical protein